MHGWINGHPHIRHLDATFGTLERFYELAESYAEEDGCDFLAVDVGDAVRRGGDGGDGTG